MKTHRCGYTLIETLVAFTMTATLLGTISLTIHSLYRADARMRGAFEDDRQLQRLSTTFRADVHRALEAVVQTAENGAADTSPLQLTMPRQTVEYAWQETELVRAVERDGATVHREYYALPRDAAPRWQVQRDGQLPLVSLTWNRPSPPGMDGTAGEQQIQAALGLLAFTRPEPEADNEDPDE